MKRSIFNQCFLIVGGLLLLFSCKEVPVNQPLEKSSGPPGPVDNVSVENLPGGARLTYTLPDDEDLLYVKAEYTLTTGREMEVKSSYYNNSLMIEGYADSLEHEVKLYAVNRGEEASQPVTVTIKPERSPIWDVFESLTAQAAFGGLRVAAHNPERSDVAIMILEKDDFGEWQSNPNSIYTSTDQISYTLRGLDTLKHDFAFTIRDRWLNYTDTLFTEISPLYETAISKSGYMGMHLPGDAEYHPSTSMAGMWDGNEIDWPSIYMTDAAYTPSTPHVITFDIGQMAKLSRIMIWDYPEYYNGRTYYYMHCLKYFEIWGSVDSPEDGSFDNWIKLGTYEATKPSGLPYGEQNDEDFQTARAGFSWEFDINAPKVRYLRIKSIENWGGSTNLAISEIQVYGDPR